MMLKPLALVLGIGAFAFAAAPRAPARQPQQPTWRAVAPESGEVHLANVRQLTFGGQNAEAYFSSDGTKIVFQSTRGDHPCDQEYVMNVDGSDVHRVSDGRGRTTCGYFFDHDRKVLFSSTSASGPDCPKPPDYSHGYVWALEHFDIYTANVDGSELRRLTHKTIRTCTDHIENFRFNVYLAALMEYTNHLQPLKETALAGTPAWSEALHTLVLLLAPITPHLAEELWARLGERYSVHQQAWPEWREDLAADEVITLVVQINGKVRDRLEVPAGISEPDAKALAVASDGAKRHIDGKSIKDVIYVPGRLVNIVVR